MNSYIYCFGRTGEINPMRVAGIDGAPLRLLECGEVTAVSSDINSAGIQADPEAVAAHNNVVDVVLAGTTPIPCRFGTILRTEMVSEFVKANNAGLQGLLELFSGRIEMSVKLSREWDDVELHPAIGAAAETRRGQGTEYLMKKHLEEASRTRRSEQIRAAGESLRVLFDGLSVKTRPFIGRDAFSAEIAHLVERSGVEHYKAVLEHAQSTVAPFRLSLSGPRAPYSFVAGWRPQGVQWAKHEEV